MSAPKKVWPTTNKAEAYWRDIAAGFMHAPDESYLNTGSWGVLHRSVFDSLVKGLEELEGNPTRNRGQQVTRLNQARRDLGAFLNAAPADLALTTNVTIAINQVVHGLDWQPGDEILASDQEYGAIDNCLHHAERRYGVVVQRAPISIPPAEPEQIVDSFRRALTARTRLLLVSHVTSPSGLITPIKELAELAHAHGAMIAVDGAHAPGQIPLDLTYYGCDFYGGNCHKWLCAPKGTGFLHAQPQVQDKLHPIAVSHGYDKDGPKRNDAGALCINGQPFMWQLTSIGTREMSCFGAVAEAVALQNEIGKEQIAARGRQLAGYLRQRMAETGWVEPLSSPHPDLANSISTFRLKGFGATNPGQLLYDKYRITTPIWGEAEPGYTQRVSTHIYNNFGEIDRMIAALDEIRTGRD
ncbi:MAG: aminotransferase class V-fold PLP-dependent enzyme [Gemmatimonadetes bacterium]|nr:aminotransferase class V-fold PLP-dependent enzyme [Gemmatimonadota bacterium]